MDNTLTKAQLDSITPNQIRTVKRLSAILANMDIDNTHPRFIELMREGMSARDYDVSYKVIESIFEDRLQGQF